MNRRNLLSFAFVLSFSPLAAQQAVNDLFNRANGTNLGVDWTEVNSDAVISGNRLQGNSPFDLGWCVHNTFNASYADTVVRSAWSMNGGGGDRISIIVGATTSTWSAIEVRIADNNGDGLADRIFWNASVNAGAWYSGPSFANLSAPMASGLATVWFTNGGNTVNLALTDTTTNVTQNYSASGILVSPPTGTKVGIGYFGNGYADDFRAWMGGPTGPSCTMTQTRVNGSPTLLVTEAASNSGVAIAYSVTGAGPIPSPFGNILLTDPISLLGIFTSDIAGRIELPMGVIPVGLQGLTFSVQSFDGTTNLLSNGFTMAVL